VHIVRLTIALLSS